MIYGTSVSLPGPSGNTCLAGRGRGKCERVACYCMGTCNAYYFMMVVHAACGWSMGAVRYAVACTVAVRDIPYVCCVTAGLPQQAHCP